MLFRSTDKSNSEGLLDSPSGIALNATGFIYVAEVSPKGESSTGEYRISVIQPIAAGSSLSITVEEAEVEEGKTVTSSLGKGKKGEFKFSETKGKGDNKVTKDVNLGITLPSNISGDVSVSTASETEIAQGTELVTAIDLEAPCTNSCTIEFTIPNDVLEAAGFTPESASIFHDIDGNELIEPDEAIATTRDTTTTSNSTIFTGTADFTSKFAVGGVVGATTAKALALGALANQLDFCKENGFGEGNSLKIYEINYDKCESNEITVLADTTCGPISMKVGTQYGSDLVGMSNDQPFLNDDERKLIFKIGRAHV